MSLLKPLYRLNRYLKQYRGKLALAVILIVISNGLYAIIPKILQRTIDAIDRQTTLTRLAIDVAILLAASFIYAVIRFFIRKSMMGISRKIEYQLRNDYFSHLQRLPHQFFVQSKTGDLMARATNDIGSVTMTIGMGLMFTITNSLVFIFVVIMMLSTNVKLAMLALIPFPMILLLMYVSFGRFYKIYEQVQESYSDITSRVHETIAGIRVIQAYVQEEHEIRQFETVNSHYLRKNLKLAVLRGVMWALMMLLFGFALIILLWIGGNAVIAKQISIGDLVAFTAWVGMLSWPMISLGWVLNLIQRASASMNRINEIMDTPPIISDGDQTDHRIKTLHGDIEFRNVTFAYNGKPVLKNISLHIPAGSTLAIIGPTGSGKSTLVELIPRLIEASSGQVLIDGIDIRRIPLKVLRSHIGFVPQETFLFSETLAENISYGVEGAHPDEIDRVAAISTIRDDLENFPDRYQTVIGERGVNLSGGQKQRTAISRALLRKPKILILDDALSSVDTDTEEKIISSLQANYFHQTTIMISHRISTVKHADWIIVLNDGEIIEQGQHEQLLAKNGFYATLYQRQLLERALEEM